MLITWLTFGRIQPILMELRPFEIFGIFTLLARYLKNYFT